MSFVYVDAFQYAEQMLRLNLDPMHLPALAYDDYLNPGQAHLYVALAILSCSILLLLLLLLLSQSLLDCFSIHYLLPFITTIITTTFVSSFFCFVVACYLFIFLLQLQILRPARALTCFGGRHKRVASD